MKDYTIEHSEFSDKVSIVETNDPAHADVINTPIKQLFGNTVANKRTVEESKEQVEAKLQAFKNEISASQTELNKALAKASKDIADSVDSKTTEILNRLAILENAVYNDIVGNPWVMTFSDLDGVELIKGNYNKAKQRLEC